MINLRLECLEQYIHTPKLPITYHTNTHDDEKFCKNMMTAKATKMATKCVLLNRTSKPQMQSSQTTTTTQHFFGFTRKCLELEYFYVV